MINFSVIICTYMRPKALNNLLKSIQKQTVYPNQIIIVDGSTNTETKISLKKNSINNLDYFLVDLKDRGLTKQRNFGINKVNFNSEIVFFLDDDTILETNYFEEILNTFTQFPEALGVGGYINNEVKWEKYNNDFKLTNNHFYFDGWYKTESLRFKLRKLLKLDSNLPPGYLPSYSHGRSLSFLPPSGKIYEVEQLMGGVSSFKKTVFDKIKFSTYFEGYGLYEDADFTIRVSKLGKLYLNTNAQLGHYHDTSGRPNSYKYGKMVINNGWYIWRVKNSNPTISDKFKWNLINLVLITIRATNIFNTNHPKQAFMETLGRLFALIKLFFVKPK